jgi:hypothetical protein
VIPGAWKQAAFGRRFGSREPFLPPYTAFGFTSQLWLLFGFALGPKRAQREPRDLPNSISNALRQRHKPLLRNAGFP